MVQDRARQFSYAYLMDHASELIICLDLQGQLILINRACEDFFKICREKLLGQNFSQFLGQFGLEKFDLKILENIQKELPVNSIECRYLINNIERYISWDMLPFINNQDCVDGLILKGSNTTEIKNIKKEFLQSKATEEKLEMLNNIIKYAPDMIYWKDKNFIHMGCNNQFAIAAGYHDRSEIIGRSDHDFPWHAEAEKYNLDDKKVIDTGQPHLNIEDVMPFKSGKKATVITNKVPLRDSHGDIIGVLGIATDITQQKKNEYALSVAKEAAEAANHAKIEFIANMSHDIRTPLTGVVGMSKILEDAIADPMQKNYAHWLGESGGQLLKMLNEILDVVSADNLNEMDLHEEAFNVKAMLQDIYELEKPSTLVKGLELISSIDEEIPPVLISDHTKLHRILLNLLGNAIKFTQEGHVKVAIKLLSRDDKNVHLQFVVSDTGIGIPKKLQEQVFDRFFRVTPSYKGVYNGRGVGLHIAQSYANLLGSNIQLTSEPNVGTSFFFNISLKIADKGAVVSGVSTSSQMISLPAKMELSKLAEVPDDAPLFLLVEDNNIALVMLENLVAQAGFRFKSVIDGETALELAKNEVFDLIIADLGLPGISGIEFTRLLRKYEKENNKTMVPIIGLTAHADPKIKTGSLHAGMNEAFTKPMSPAILDNVRLNYFSPLKKSSQTDDSDNEKYPIGSLGLDLPNTEKELFELDSFVLLDINKALIGIGNNSSLLKTILQSMVEDELPRDLKEIEVLHTKGDWSGVESLAHRMKGGLVYCGADKLACACQYLERYKKAGHSAMLEALYQQLLRIADETVREVKKWLSA
ncbi:MAG: ATP-binding protein [Legionellaceae bacterium]|nr:ATP-binding protein [Legionellaceae bacterium]